MATPLNLGTGGSPTSSDKLNAATGLNGGVPDLTDEEVQRAKIGFGLDGFFQDVNAANPLPVSNPTTLPLPTGAATSANQQTNALTDAQLRATAVPISGTVTATGPLTDTQLRATAVPISAASLPGVADVTASGSLAALNATAALTITSGYSAAVIQITGTWVGTITFEGTADGTNWVSINAVVAGSSTPGPTTTVNGIVRLTPAGMTQVRANMTLYTSGTAVITLRASQGTGGTFLNQSLTAGSNIIGKVGIDQTTPGTTNLVALTAETVKVIGTINIAASQTVGLASGAAVIGALTANQSVNKALINGVVPLMGNGVTGTGSQRVTIASDNTAIPVNATLAAETVKVIGTVNVAAAQTIAVTQATAANLNATTAQLAITKGTQGATGVTTQDLKDAGRNAVHYYAVIPVLTSATDTLQSLTGTKGGVTVVATATPAVVTAGNSSDMAFLYDCHKSFFAPSIFSPKSSIFVAVSFRFCAFSEIGSAAILDSNLSHAPASSFLISSITDSRFFFSPANILWTTSIARSLYSANVGSASPSPSFTTAACISVCSSLGVLVLS